MLQAEDKITKAVKLVYDQNIEDIKKLLPDLKAEADRVTKKGDLEVDITKLAGGSQLETLLIRQVFTMPQKWPLSKQAKKELLRKFLQFYVIA